ncbi:MAG: twin-arginine translocation signal domain-containing protein [Pirellulales bacterium]|nr:twin-arginine translocation signal domain-containing protein [Pirellulales bacterium]
MKHTRRDFIKAAGTVSAGACLIGSGPLAASQPPTDEGETAKGSRVASFRCDVTPLPGQPMFCSDPLKTVELPLLAKGIVLEADGQRYVLCALDWCELCNGSYDKFRAKIAAAAGTKPSNVAIQTIHQHTAPLVDCDAQRILAEAGVPQFHISPGVEEDIKTRLAESVRNAAGRLEPFDQVGVGQAKVERVAASRRPVDETGKVVARFSKCKDPKIIALPEGTVDPYLKTIAFIQGGKPLVRLHYYATHPQTSYGDGRASSDFVGAVRERIEKEEGVPQIYFTGCAGDITVGKYNDGSKECRDKLTKNFTAGMKAAIAATKTAPAGEVRWRTYPLLFKPRTDEGYRLEDCLTRVNDSKASPAQRSYTGAMRAAFHQRKDRPIELSCLEIGDVSILHLPGEPMICFQLYAQELKPDCFVAVAGYGDGGPGYLCPEKVFSDNGGYEQTVSNVVPESDKLLKKAIAALLGIDDTSKSVLH